MCPQWVVLTSSESDLAFPDPVSVVCLCWAKRSESQALESFLSISDSPPTIRRGRAPATFIQTNKHAFTGNSITKENKTGDELHFKCWLASDWN